MGTTGLWAPAVPHRTHAGSLYSRQGKLGINPKLNQRKLLQTERGDKSLTGQDGFLHCTRSFQLFTYTRCTVPSSSSRNPCQKDEEGNDKRFLPTNSNSLGKFNLLNRICTADGIWKPGSYQTAPMFTGCVTPTVASQNQVRYGLSITIMLCFIW